MSRKTLKRRLVRRPSPALVVAMIALGAASAGVANGGIGGSKAPTAAAGPFITGTHVLDGSLTGADINQATLTAVANAVHANSADAATNAGHATTADNATNAGHATTADNANALGGVAAGSYVQRGCSAGFGQIKGFGRVVASAAFPATYTSAGISTPYNCSGQAVQAKRVSMGEYDVKFVGSPVGFAVVTSASSTGDVGPNVDAVGLSLIGPGEFRVGIYNVPTATLIDSPFIILTF